MKIVSFEKLIKFGNFDNFILFGRFLKGLFLIKKN